MWNNGFNGEFIGPMGQESIVKSTTRPEVKASGIAGGSPLFHIMNKLMSKFNDLEERMFGAPIAILPHVTYTSESPLAFSQPQYERPFYYYFDQCGRLIFENQSELAFSMPETDRANSRGFC